MNEKFDCIVIGGGAAGMMAAQKIAACCSVLLLDKNKLLGRKLRITGKGRCNVTNDCDLNTFLNNVPQNSKFLYSALSRFSTADTVNFFEERGVPLKTERGRRVFPESDKAADIANVLADTCKKAGVVVVDTPAISIICENDFVTGVRTAKGDYACKYVLLATGGLSYPSTGSDGDGYRIAKELSHTITAIRPSLVALCSKNEDCADMQGLSLKNVEASLFDKQKQKPIFNELGEMLFTHFGMSGPLILSASAHIREWEEDRFYIAVDLKPGLSEQQLDARLLRDFVKFQNRDFMNSLSELLPAKMIPIIIKRSGIPPFTKVNSITREQRGALLQCLKALTFSVDGFRSIDEAIVTSGGVAVTEINPKTMESKLVSGLYFAGEVIDVDGYTGGFNIQIAFSTAMAAAEAIADKML